MTKEIGAHIHIPYPNPRMERIKNANAPKHNIHDKDTIAPKP